MLHFTFQVHGVKVNVARYLKTLQSLAFRALCLTKDTIMVRRRGTSKRVRRRKRQKGGILPLAALIPALLAGGKAVTAGALSAAAGYCVKRGLEALEKKSIRRR